MRVAQTLLLSLAIWSSSTIAHDHHDHDLARSLRTQGAIVSLETIADAAARLQPGSLLEVELKRRGEAYLYEVEILDENGRTWELLFDARDGKLIKRHEED